MPRWDSLVTISLGGLSVAFDVPSPHAVSRKSLLSAALRAEGHGIHGRGLTRAPK